MATDVQIPSVKDLVLQGKQGAARLGIRILRLPEVKVRCGLSRSAIYDRMDPASPRFDPRFPKRVCLGRAVGWVEHEVDDYLAQLVADSRGGVQ